MAMDATLVFWFWLSWRVWRLEGIWGDPEVHKTGENDVALSEADEETDQLSKQGTTPN